jgi:sarcosine oxidase subunit gamma
VHDAATSNDGAGAAGDHGAGASAVTFAEATIATAWILQGDASQQAFIDAARRLSGVSLPLRAGTALCAGARAALWLGPRSWLLLDSDARLPVEFETARSDVNSASGALFDVSAARVAWNVCGPAAGRILMRQCPVDLHARAFPAGSCAQSLLGHIQALVWKRELPSAFTVMVARSYANDAWHLLCESAAAEGYRVAAPAAILPEQS